jgi:hypothetical protein
MLLVPILDLEFSVLDLLFNEPVQASAQENKTSEAVDS